MDETSFYLYPKGYLVLAEKGSHVYDTSAKSDKENITTLITVSADGVIAPPLTVYKYKRMNQEIARTTPSYWGLGKTDSGWMTGEAFYEYFTNVFYPYLISSKIKLPVIVFLDGHSSHLTMHLGMFCKEHQIILVCLFPNTTHILQPLDVSVFAPLKAKWKSTVRQWRVDNDGKEICKQDVPTVLHTILKNSNFTNSIKSGFRVCGLFPWNADNVDYSKCTLKECPTNTSTQKSESTNLLYLKNFEKYIQPDLKEFYLTKDRHTDWEGSMTASDLYDVWDKMLFDQNQNILQPSISCEANELQTINTPNDSTGQLQTIELNNISPNSNFNDTTVSSNISTPNSSNKSFEDVMADVIKWPEPVPNNTRKYCRVKLPTVVTSQKWLDIKSAQDEEKSKKCVKRVKTVVEKSKKNEKGLPKKKCRKKIIFNSSGSDSDSDEDNITNELNNDNIDDDYGMEELYKIGDFVIVQYEGEYFPGVVNDTNLTSALVSVMTMSGSGWKWPNEDDEIWYKFIDVMQLIKPPEVSNSRGICLVPEISKYRK